MKKYATNIAPGSLGSSDVRSNTAQAHVFGDSKPKLKSRPLDNRNRFLVQKTSDGKGGYTIQPYQLTPQERERVSAGVDEVKKYTSHPGYKPQSGTVLSDKADGAWSWKKKKDAYGSGRPVQVASKESRRLAKDSPLAKDILDQSAAQVDAIALQGKEREALLAARLLELSRGYYRRKAFHDAANNLVGGKLRMSPGEVFPNVHSSALPITLGSMAATDTPEKFRFKDIAYEQPDLANETKLVDYFDSNDSDSFWRNELDAVAKKDRLVRRDMPSRGARLVRRDKLGRRDMIVRRDMPSRGDSRAMESYLRGKPSFMGDLAASGKVPIVEGDDFAYMPFPKVPMAELNNNNGFNLWPEHNPDGKITVQRRQELPSLLKYYSLPVTENDFRHDYMDANGERALSDPASYAALNDSYDEYGYRMHEVVHSRTSPLSDIYANRAKKLDAVFGTGPFDRKSPKQVEGYADTSRVEFTRAMGVFKDALLRDLINSGMSPEEATRKVQDPQFVRSRLRGIYDDMQDPQLPLRQYATHSYHYPGTMVRDNNSAEVDRAVLGLQPFAQRLLYTKPDRSLVYDMTKDTIKDMPNQRLYNRLRNMFNSSGSWRQKEIRYNPADTDLLFYDDTNSTYNRMFNDKNKYEDFNREISPEELQQAFDIIWPQVRNKELNDRNNNLV